MKIRNGFVSNSSTSSFIVVLPKVPAHPSELKEMLFGDEVGGVSLYEYRPSEFIDIAIRVYKDIFSARDNKGNSVPKIATFSSLVDSLMYMPRYIPKDDNTLKNAKNLDEYGGRWINLGEFLTQDNKDLKKLRDIKIKIENLWEKYNANRNSIIQRIINKASKSSKLNHKTYSEEVEKMSKKDKKYLDNEYLTLEKDFKRVSDKMYKREEKLRIVIAKKQAKAFLEKYKGKFIFVTSYGDRDGEVILEHGDVFCNVPHIKISNH